MAKLKKDCIHILNDLGNLKIVRVDEQCPYKQAQGNMFLANAYRCKKCEAYKKRKTPEIEPETPSDSVLSKGE